MKIEDFPVHVQQAIRDGILMQEKSDAKNRKPTRIEREADVDIIETGQPNRYTRAALVEIKDKPKAKGKAKPQQMNKTEQERADELELELRAGKICWWDFQPFSLNIGRTAKGKVIKYRPDLVWMDTFTGEITCEEIKGFWREASRARVKIASGVFWFFNFVGLMKAKGGGWDREEF